MATSLKLIKELKLENNKVVEKITREIKVYKNKDKRKYQRVIRTKNTYYYPKDENGVPILNWKNRIWDDSFDNIGERVPLFSDFIISNLQTLLCQV